MKNVSPQMLAFLEAVQSHQIQNFYMADLFTVTLNPVSATPGPVFYWTSFDIPIVFNGHTFVAMGPLLQRSAIKTALGLEVGTIDLEILADPTAQVNNLPILQAIGQGAFDGALVRVERLFMATPGDTTNGSIVLWVGTVSDVSELGRTHAKMTVSSLTEYLNRPLPGILYSPHCIHTLYDAGCTLNPSNFRASGTANAGGNVNTFGTNLSTSLYPGALAPPTAAPSLSYSSAASGVRLPAVTYWVIYTYVGATGESLPSPQVSLSVPVNSLLHVASPTSGVGALTWNVYVGLSPGDEQLQLSSISFGTPWIESNGGLIAASGPPVISQSGYFSQGVISWTSGPNSGLSYSVEQYSNVGGVGTITVVPAMFSTPSAGGGDAFTIVPGCEKSLTTCTSKFNNRIHFRGAPWIPQPVQGIT